MSNAKRCQIKHSQQALEYKSLIPGIPTEFCYTYSGAFIMRTALSSEFFTVWALARPKYLSILWNSKVSTFGSFLMYCIKWPHKQGGRYLEVPIEEGPTAPCTHQKLLCTLQCIWSGRYSLHWVSHNCRFQSLHLSCGA